MDRILELTDGEGVHESLEFSGAAPALVQGVKVVRPGGGVHMLGLFNGPVSLDLTNDVIMRGIALYGITGRRMFRTWYEMAGLLRSGNVNLKPIVTHRFALQDYVKAIEVVRSRQCGKVVLRVGGGS